MHKTKKTANGFTEYEEAMRFLEIGCNCGCAELREAFLDPNKIYF